MLVPLRSLLRRGLFLLATSPAAAQSPQILLDVNPLPGVGSNGGILCRSPRQPEVLLGLDDGVLGRELWRTDGTPAGTMPLVDLSPGPGSTEFYGAASDPQYAWFLANRGGGAELWRTDGTAAGTLRLLDGSSVGAQFLGVPDVRWPVNGARLFRVHNTLWRTDGTVAGTFSLGVEVGDVVTVANGLALVRGWFGQLIVTDGTTATALGLLPGHLEITDDGRLFTTAVAWIGMQPRTTVTWVNGPGAPTVTVFGSAQVVPIPGAFVFATQGELFVWDGSGLASWLGTFSGGIDAGTAQRFGDEVVFVADDGVTGHEIWFTDGTLAGTRALDLAPGPAGTDPGYSIQVGGRLMIWPVTAIGREPWLTDGTLAGTTLLLDAAPGPASSYGGYYPEQLGGERRRLMTMNTPAAGLELWQTDGTTAGTFLVGDLRPGPASSIQNWQSNHQMFVPCGDALLWMVEDGTHGVEPWILPLPGTRTPIQEYGPRRFTPGDPVLGASMTLHCERMSPNELGAVVLGLPAPVAVPIAPMRFAHFDPVGALVVAVAVPAAGGTWNGSLRLPNQPSAVGLDFVVQPIFLPSPLPLGLDVGDAFWLSLGF